MFYTVTLKVSRMRRLLRSKPFSHSSIKSKQTNFFLKASARNYDLIHILKGCRSMEVSPGSGGLVFQGWSFP